MPQMFEPLEARTFLSADTYLCSRGHVHSLAEEAHVMAATSTTPATVTPAKSGRTIAARPTTPTTPATTSAKSGRTLAARRAVTLGQLKVSPDGRYIVNEDGSPFFYMADSAWHLFNKLTESEADLYLETRAQQGFTVIQAEINARYDENVNVMKEPVYIDGDFTRPNEAFFRHVDYIVNKANALGMYVSMVPLDTKLARAGRYSLADAYTVGRYMGERYRNAKIIWTVGADIGADEVPQGVDLWREAAAGIARGAADRDMSKVLMQYHPRNGQSSSSWFQDDAWLDLNAFQSGHNSNPLNYRVAAAVYPLTPAKPFMDIEPGYEDMPDGVQIGARRLDDYDIRKAEYWSLFAGSHGVTFGNNNVWQFVVEPGQTRNLANHKWQDALDSPGARSMMVLKRLMLSRPFLSRIPDQSLLVSDPLTGTDHIQATRAADGAYAFVYSASGQPVRVDLAKISGPAVTIRWFNPRNGRSTLVGTFGRKRPRTLIPPTTGTDWILILDDASKNFGKP